MQMTQDLEYFMESRKAVGQRGSWFAEVDGELLPCSHKHWFQPSGEYNDPGVEEGTKIWDDFIGALKATSKTILTTDNVSPDERQFERTGYIAVFAIDDVRVEDGCLRFRFVDRLCHLK